MANVARNTKPLGHKSYGSIAHLPGSRLGPGEHTVHEGQARIATQHVPGRKDRVIITEKLDGSNVAVAKVDGQILALSRAGYLATTSPYEQHHLFAAWVRERWLLFDELLAEGERVCGEWLAQAHGTRYQVDADSVFVAFDLMRGHQRSPYTEMLERVRGALCVAAVIEIGPRQPDWLLSQMAARAVNGLRGYHGAQEPIEGLVYRVETAGRFNFIAKYVRADFEPGRYLPELNGGEAVWNWRPA